MESSNVIGEPAAAAEEINQDDQDDQQVQSSQSAQNQISQTRTYECNFCKRGFSNAQALGGHMNIHRKDKDKLAKAKKLKHHPLPNPPNYQQQFLLDISSNTLTAPPADKLKSPNFEDQRPANIVRLPNWDFHKEDDSGTATSRNQVSDAQNHSIFGGENDDNGDGVLEPELDLELRLGHEPTQSDSTPMGTRKFF